MLKIAFLELFFDNSTIFALINLPDFVFYTKVIIFVNK